MKSPETPSIQHIAFIMDGNGRWAKKRFLPRAAGHAKGAAQVKRIIEACAERDVRYVTLYAFSTENWARPSDEVSALMSLFLKCLQSEVRTMRDNGIRLRVFGNRTAFSEEIQAAITFAEDSTAKNNRLHLSVAANYGGRAEMIRAVQTWMTANPNATPQEFDEQAIEAHLYTTDVPPPDLLIRTGGECRISNFLLWQTAYTELYFTDTLWPEFGAKSLDKALAWFATRERRFGKTSEQVLEASNPQKIPSAQA
jgi:undecaprenyl diphosphate synthase